MGLKKLEARGCYVNVSLETDCCGGELYPKPGVPSEPCSDTCRKFSFAPCLQAIARDVNQVMYITLASMERWVLLHFVTGCCCILLPTMMADWILHEISSHGMLYLGIQRHHLHLVVRCE